MTISKLVKFIKLIEIKKDKTILEVAEDSNIKIKASCDGKGKCGKCLVRASGILSVPSKAELKLINGKKLSQGYRLACEAVILGDVEVIMEE